MSIDQIKGLPTEVFEMPQWQDANYTEEPEEDKALSLGEIMDQNYSRNSINLDHSPHESPEAEEKVDTLSMIMSHGSPVYQVQVKGTSVDDFSLHPEKDPFNLQPTLSSSKNELHLNLEKQVPDFDTNHSQNEHSPMWSLNTQDIKSEIQNLDGGRGKFTTTSSAFQKDSNRIPENKKDKSPFNLDSLPLNMKLNRHSSEASSSRQRWAKLGHVVHSLALMKREEVKNIVRSDDLDDGITSFKIGKIKAASAREQDFVMKNDFEGDAFDLVRRVQVFCDCAAIGSPEHIKMMIKLIERDPKKFMIEPNDPQHLLNKTNSQGWSPLYIAAKYGNLNVVKLLIENKANYKLKCKINPNHSKEELPLKVATKWGHAEVVEYLLKNGEYDKTVLKSCIKKSPNQSVKISLEKYQKETLRSKSEMNIFSKWFQK